ncbi:MAG: hypothetical protein FJ009_02645 [Chloroflexi bacterium]|nr:hypothetical protein [Chloroflexota bacterium]
MILSKAFSNSQTGEFYARLFKPRFDALQKAVQQTPLVLMMWGPRQRTQIWSNQRRRIRDTLQRNGHTVFFSEQLGVPIAAITKKGLEFLQSETADLIIVVQSAYDAVGAVQHFSEFRVVDSKMLLFMDEAASDERLYHRAVEDLRAAYNNVETYSYPTDIVHDNLIIKITEKIKLLQLVKYCALERAASWRLGIDTASPTRVRLNVETQPFQFNLLELYRDHRDEVDVLADSAALFVLAYANYIGKCAPKALAHQVGLDDAAMRVALMPLLRSQMMVHLDDVLQVTGFGRRVLESAGMIGWMTPAAAPRAQPAPAPRRTTWVRNLSVAMAGVLFFFLIAFYWLSTNQQQLPLQYTPTRPAVTQTATPIITPSPVRR